MFSVLFINAFKLRYTPMRSVPSLSPFYRWGIHYIALPKFTELGSGRPKISTPAFWLHSHTLSFRAIQSPLQWYLFCRALVRDGVDSAWLWLGYCHREQRHHSISAVSFQPKDTMNFFRVSWWWQYLLKS